MNYGGLAMIQYRGEKIDSQSVAQMTDSSAALDDSSELKRIFEETGYL